MAGPSHPENRWFYLAVGGATLLALLLFALIYWLSTRTRSFSALDEAARNDLAQLQVLPSSTSTVEREWVSKDFETGLLIAPIGPPPCEEAIETLPPGDREVARTAFAAVGDQNGEARIESLAPISESQPNNLIVALLLGTELVRVERHQEADFIISRALNGTQFDEDIIKAAKQANTPLDLGDGEVSTIIHLHHALGIAQLNSGKEPWIALKNVIGAVKALSAKRLIGTAIGQATAAKLLVPAAGCRTGTLTSYHLYNNLITGYARASSYPPDDTARKKEFGRHLKNDPRPLNVLLQTQLQRETESGWKNEARLWALSNTKELLDWRYPDDARLDFNLVQIIDWWVVPERCPADVCSAEMLSDIQRVRDRLLLEAIRKHNVNEGERPQFATGITRMLAGSSIDRSTVASELATIAGWLPPAKASVLTDLQNAAEARAALPRWIVQPDAESGSPFDKLGHNAGTLRTAAIHDFVETASIWAAARSAEEKKAFIIAARQLLGTADAPPALVSLEAGIGPMQRLSIRLAASKIWWAFVAFVVALFLWFMLVFVLVQFRESRSLHRSFYNIELGYQRATGLEGPRRK